MIFVPVRGESISVAIFKEMLMQKAQSVFSDILVQLGGVENLQAVGVDVGTIKPISQNRKEYGGYTLYGLQFEASDNKVVDIILELDDVYSIYVNEEKIDGQFYFDDLITQVELIIGARMPYCIVSKMVSSSLGDTEILRIEPARVLNPFYVG